MPSRPRRFCHRCGAVTRARRCSCSGERHRELDAVRGNSTARGYGREWRSISEDYRARHPWCEHHKAKGRLVPVALVDHVVPKDEGGSDDDSNLCSLCRSCHARKTAADKRRAKARREGVPQGERHFFRTEGAATAPWRRASGREIGEKGARRR